ncbi:MAG: AAA family ATPase [Planctomycetes bacterium]|nr:AAA family ATPase [Planctomycetota bacterium]
MAEHDEIRSLRDALSVTPDNLPLRLHLAERLMQLGRAEEAASEFRDALSRAPNNPACKIGLARAFYEQEKNSEALVIVEDLIRNAERPAAAYLLHARLLLRAGDVARAVREYKKAVDDDPGVADEALAERLGVTGFEEASGSEVVDGKLRQRGDDEEGPSNLAVERPKIAFKDVGGMEDLKEEIRMKIIHPMTHPEVYKAYGKSIGGGILMYGPPGCGKTHMARATAGEVKARFLSIGIHDVLDMWIGQSERNLHEIFETARRNKPCVLFFDEVDALGASRSDMRQAAGRHQINQFLSELDGDKGDNDGVLILAATNAPWHLDSAFRRPGRFDRILFVPPPDAPARAQILRILMQGKPADGVDYDHIGKKTDAFSGADLKGLVDVAVEGKLKEAMKAGVPKPLNTKDLLNAAKGLRQSTKEWFATARNYALYSNQGGIYDDILKYLKL